MAKKSNKNIHKGESENIADRIPMLKTLNSQQQSAKKQIINFLQGDDKFFLLKGGAGTGKTHTVGALIAHLQAENNRLWIAASAPTNKAVKVLRNTANQWRTHNIDYGTIYQFLGLTLDYDDEGDRVLVEGNRSTIDKYELVIIDEASMISSRLWNLLNEVVNRDQDPKFLLIGDNAQLNPVNEMESPIFSQVKNIAELTEVMRTNLENPVIDIIQSAREKVFNPQYRYFLQSSFTSDLMNGVWVLNRAKWLNQMIRAFQSPKYQHNPDYVRAIAWRNKTVNCLNQYIREAIYDDVSKPYLSRERLIATDTIFDYLDGEEILLSNSDEFEVLKAHKTVSEDGYYIWRLKVVDEEGRTYSLQVIDQSSQPQFLADLGKLAQEAHQKKLARHKKPWEKYWQYKNRYAQVNYAYAMTSHKSQGSTFTNVFVAQNDICKNQNLVERYRSLYVSYSRCSGRLIINI